MVFGIGEGKLDLTLDKISYCPGQTIKGRLILMLKEPEQARELRVRFYGLVRRRKHYAKVFLVEQKLGPERTYHSGEGFDFSLAIDPEALPPKVEGIFGSAAEFIYSINPTRFFVEATLDMPMKFDINNKKQVQITRMPGTPTQ